MPCQVSRKIVGFLYCFHRGQTYNIQFKNYWLNQKIEVVDIFSSTLVLKQNLQWVKGQHLSQQVHHRRDGIGSSRLCKIMSKIKISSELLGITLQSYAIFINIFYDICNHCSVSAMASLLLFDFYGSAVGCFDLTWIWNSILFYYLNQSYA